MTAGGVFARCRGIVFDLDGTLIDSYEAIAKSLNHALRQLGYPEMPADRVRSLVGRGLESLIERALRERGAGDPVAETARGVTLFRRCYEEVCVPGTRLLPEVAQTLAILADRGYKMAVATNKPSYFADRLMTSLGIRGYFACVLGPDLVTHPKPHPEMVTAALEKMELKPPEAVYIGDMEVDVQTARAAGVPVIVLPTGSSSIDELRRCDADALVESFGGLLDFLPRAW